MEAFFQLVALFSVVLIGPAVVLLLAIRKGNLLFI